MVGIVKCHACSKCVKHKSFPALWITLLVLFTGDLGGRIRREGRGGGGGGYIVTNGFSVTSFVPIQRRIAPVSPPAAAAAPPHCMVCNERKHYGMHSVGSKRTLFCLCATDKYSGNDGNDERNKDYDSEHDNDNNDDDDEDDDDDDYEDIPQVDTSTFTPPPTIISYGLHRGKSSPLQRKAFAKSSSSSTSVHVCTNCGSEFVKWFGKCPTCQEWNCIQEIKVGRTPGAGAGAGAGAGIGGRSAGLMGGGGGGGSSNNIGRPIFGSSPRRKGASSSSSSSSWLDGVDSYQSFNSFYQQPIRMTDVYKEMGMDLSSLSDDDGEDGDGTTAQYKRKKEQRICVPNDEELNNVLGGGIMPGSLTLLGGDPGVGKSTLLLQTAGSIASLSKPPRGIGVGLDDPTDHMDNHGPVLYVSGEENAMQIASRAARLGIDTPQLLLFCETDADYIADTVVSFRDPPVFGRNNVDDEVGAAEQKQRSFMRQQLPPSLVMIDSIQTMVCESGGTSAAGGVTQVRECVGLFLRLAKSTGIPIILVGHVTKSGDVAGPRTVEHMVDCVLYLEGERTHGGGGGNGGLPNLRMLRASKNRFGSSEEVGVYEMNGSADAGGRLIPVSDPSSLFLSTRMDTADDEGCAISLVMEGVRPMTVEVQALVSRCAGGGMAFAGRRTVDGVSLSRLLLILAVLQKRYGISFHKQDVYLNVVGGVRLSRGTNKGSESDLAVAAALVSSLSDIPVRSDTAFVGEVGLLGELRPVPSVEKRINEARRMGFSRIITPSRHKNRKRRVKQGGANQRRESSARGIDWIECDTLLDAINAGLTRRLPERRKSSGSKTKQIQKGGSSEFGIRIDSPGAIHELMLGDDAIEDDEEDNIFE